MAERNPERRLSVSSASIRIGGTGAREEHFAGAKRVNYFVGQLLSASDFRAEQQYLIERRFLHNRLLHGFGIAVGLSVTSEVSESSATVVIGPGLALDQGGREMGLDAPMTLPLGEPGCPCMSLVNTRSERSILSHRRPGCSLPASRRVPRSDFRTRPTRTAA